MSSRNSPPSAAPITTIEGVFHHGLELLRRGQPREAERAFRHILASLPSHIEAAHHVAICLSQRGEFAAALPFYDSVLHSVPKHAQALANRGNALRELGRLDESVISFDRALRLDPRNPVFHSNRGNSLAEMQRHVDALAAYDTALNLNPRHVGAWYNKGTLLAKVSRHEDALACFNKVLEISPAHVDALINLAIAQGKLGQFASALASYDRAIALNVRDPRIYVNRGLVLLRLRQAESALLDAERALALDEGMAEAHVVRAEALRELGRLNEAQVSYSAAIRLKPSLPYLIGSWAYSLLRACSWSSIDSLRQQVIGEKASAPFPLVVCGVPIDVQNRLVRQYVRDNFPSGASLSPEVAYGHERIRVGYFSADFSNHPVTHLMAEVWERHDRSRIHSVAFSFGKDTRDPWRQRVEAAFDQFVDVAGMNDREIAELVRSLEIDVAVDMMGFTAHARTGIFALRPAPIQVNYLGYPGTMGAEFIDYIIADRMVIPPHHREYYTERVVWLPGAYLPIDSTKAISAKVPSRLELGLPEGGFVFCCFNNSYKITPDVFDVWMRLLQRIPDSVLWLSARGAEGKANLLVEAKRRGVAPDRLIFAPAIDLADHFARHQQAGLFLDTFSYNAHTTASDALWSGLPVITLLGQSFAGRVAASLLETLGLPELIVHDVNEYEALAYALATQPDRLAALRQVLAQKLATSCLFDTPRFTRNLERVFAQMVKIHQDGRVPEPFALEDE